MTSHGFSIESHVVDANPLKVHSFIEFVKKAMTVISGDEDSIPLTHSLSAAYGLVRVRGAISISFPLPGTKP